jgi:hypothetical protein
MATPTKTLRLRPELRAEIERIARRSRRSFSEVAQDLLDEALRMREVPGVYFANEPAGREAKVAGTGLGVWEVIRDYLAAGKKLDAARCPVSRPRRSRPAYSTTSDTRRRSAPRLRTMSRSRAEEARLGGRPRRHEVLPG